MRLSGAYAGVVPVQFDPDLTRFTEPVPTFAEPAPEDQSAFA